MIVYFKKFLYLGEKQSWAEPKPPQVRLISDTQPPVKPYTTVPAQVAKAAVTDSPKDGPSFTLSEEAKDTEESVKKES